jgi:hypothetical protein
MICLLSATSLEVTVKMAVVTMVNAVFVFASLIAERYCGECRFRLCFWVSKRGRYFLNPVRHSL